MNNLDITDYLPILSIGLWVGVSITFISKIISFVISTCINWFKRAI